VGFCALLALTSAQGFLMDIAIAWTLQSYVAVLALAKYLEGKHFNE
jgi:multisubunit Na+/H+ antiporter MnhF subunit